MLDAARRVFAQGTVDDSLELGQDARDYLVRGLRVLA
jgi:hypothetical protein